MLHASVSAAAILFYSQENISGEVPDCWLESIWRVTEHEAAVEQLRDRTAE